MGTFYEELEMNSRELTDQELGFKDRSKLKGDFATLFFASVIFLLIVVISFLVKSALLEIAKGICYIVTGVTLIKIGYSEGRDTKLYYMAGVAQLISGIMWCVSEWINWYFWASYFSLELFFFFYCAGIVFICFAATCEYKAYARTVELVDGYMADKWRTYTKMYLVSMIGVIVVLVLNVCFTDGSGFLQILFWGFAIFFGVVNILKAVYLSKTTSCL